MSIQTTILCECGCGGKPNSGNRFINHHHWNNKKHSPESKAKISKSKINPSMETRKKLSDIHKGIPLSEEHKQKISLGGMGKTMSEEARMKISIGNTGKKRTSEQNKKQSDRMKEKICSAETKLKISIANKNPSVDTRIKMSLAKKNPSISTRRKMSESHKRINLSDETRKKLSDAKIGRIVSKETRKKISESHKGVSLTAEHRKNISKSHIGLQLGENHPNWKGGVSFEPYCDKFNNAKKEEIRNLFNRKCMLCGKTEIENKRKLSIHHIDYSKLQGCEGKPWNLVPLCTNCHGKTSSGDRTYWENYITELINGGFY